MIFSYMLIIEASPGSGPLYRRLMGEGGDRQRALTGLTEI
jgi:hypothetical protein